MTEMNTLQQLIVRRAEKRLDDEINAIMSAGWKASRLLKKPGHVSTTYKDRDGGYPMIQYQNAGKNWETTTLNGLFISHNQLWRSIREAWLPIYIQEESELFLKQIDEIKEKMTNFDEQIDDLRRNNS